MMKIKIKADDFRLTTTDLDYALSILVRFKEKAVADKEAKGRIEPEYQEAKETTITPEMPKHYRNIIVPFPKQRTKSGTRNIWTKEEDEYVFDRRLVEPRDLANDPYLRQRHSKKGIRTRHNLIVKGRLGGLSADRRKFLTTLIKGVEVKKKTDEAGFIKKAKKAKRVEWSKEEMAILLNNLKEKPAVLRKILPDRTRYAINAKVAKIKRMSKKQ